ncbi:VanZ family protein [Streptomyces sp. NPDC021212]|uniref:VanZ family protein n=1 Tax=Streptomyces sp. NPDC021212 TaxID=3365118 RepID=UPI0037B3E0FF
MFSIAGWEIRRTVKGASAKKAPPKSAKGTKGTTGGKSTKGTTGAKSTASAAKGKAGSSASGRAKTAGAAKKPVAGSARKKPSGVAAKKTGAARKAAGAVAAKAAAARKPQGSPAPAAPAEPSGSPPLQRDSFGSRAGRVLVLLLAFVCMVGFAAALAKATLVPQPGSSALVHTNLRPGDSLRAYIDQPAIRDTVKQIGGNVLLGAPFGVLLPMLVPKARGAVRVVLVTSLVMVLVEVAQGAIVEGRAFDIDDVILNTSGALLGYVLIGRRLGHALHPRRHHWWQRRSSSA